MKILISLLSIFFSFAALGQIKDSIYINKQNKLVLKSAPNVEDRSLITVDGKTYKGKLEDIDVFAIDNFDVMKAPDAANVFGPAGKNGTVMFTMIDKERLRVATERFKSISEFIQSKKPLVVVNHVTYKGTTKAINPYSIHNVDILNTNDAVARFGNSASNGAVLINTTQKIDKNTGLLN